MNLEISFYFLRKVLTRLFYNDRMNKRAKIGEQEGL